MSANGGKTLNATQRHERTTEAQAEVSLATNKPQGARRTKVGANLEAGTLNQYSVRSSGGIL
jgi:hypothetical protein